MSVKCEPQQLHNFIGGEMREAASGRTLESVNPATGQLHTLVPDSGPQDLELAVQAAQRAVGPWKAIGPQGRAKVLLRLADLMEERLEEFVEAEVNDNGMTRRFASKVEVPRGAQNLRSFANACEEFCQPQDFANDLASGYVSHEPVGIAGTISPWNLPLLLFTWKIAPALASGNCVIAKPSEVTPLTASLLSRLVNEAGFPPGALNLLHGSGLGIGAPLTEHKAISRLSFTGSTATGRAIGVACAQAFKKPPMLEMGGKNPSLVFEDADFEAALDGVCRAAFANSGQICLCGSRIYVQQSLYPKFLDALVARAESIQVGDPLAPDTQQGALVSQSHLDKVLAKIALAKQEGARILCGGERVSVEGRCAQGYFVAPTLLDGLDNGSRTNQEEIFGPVASLTPFQTEAEAIALANQSSYGLAATIWSQDLVKARRVADALEAGMPWINCWNLRVLETPFGGTKDSGNGHREGVPYGMEFFTEKKTVTMPGRKA